EVVVPVRRRAPEAARRLAAEAGVVPAAAPAHPVRALLIGAPLPHVAMHVAQPQFVRWVGAYPRWPLEVLPLRRLAERRVAVEVRLLGRQVVRRLSEVEVVRTFFFRSSPSPTSI